MTKKKQPVLLYDIQSLPYSMSLQNIADAFTEKNIVIFDSSKKGERPQLLDGDISEIVFQDMTGQLELFNDDTDSTITNPEDNGKEQI